MHNKRERSAKIRKLDVKGSFLCLEKMAGKTVDRESCCHRHHIAMTLQWMPAFELRDLFGIRCSASLRWDEMR